PPMPEPETLLITDDPSLVEVVQGVTSSITGLSFRTVAAIAEACSRLQQHEVALLLPHLTRGSDPAGIVRLLETVVASSQPVAVVGISDRSQVEHAQALLRQGAADYLDRPLNVERLTWLIDTLTARVRCEPGPARPAPEASASVPLRDLDPFLGISFPHNDV